MTASEETNTHFQSITKLRRETEERMTDYYTFSRGSLLLVHLMACETAPPVDRHRHRSVTHTVCHHSIMPYSNHSVQEKGKDHTRCSLQEILGHFIFEGLKRIRLIQERCLSSWQKLQAHMSGVYLAGTEFVRLQRNIFPWLGSTVMMFYEHARGGNSREEMF